jgi:hypothetical protein
VTETDAHSAVESTKGNDFAGKASEVAWWGQLKSAFDREKASGRVSPLRIFCPLYRRRGSLSATA